MPSVEFVVASKLLTPWSLLVQSNRQWFAFFSSSGFQNANTNSSIYQGMHLWSSLAAEPMPALEALQIVFHCCDRLSWAPTLLPQNLRTCFSSLPTSASDIKWPCRHGQVKSHRSMWCDWKWEPITLPKGKSHMITLHGNMLAINRHNSQDSARINFSREIMWCFSWWLHACRLCRPSRFDTNHLHLR